MSLHTGVSRTAVMIAQAREAESARPDRLFDDPLAGPLVEAAGRIPAVSEAGRRAAEHFVLRTRFFDDVLLEAAKDGLSQVVLLAAGLDTRAFRLDWPGGTRLYEVDLPGLVEFKERTLAAQGARPRCARTVVPADLREDWPAELVAAGLDPAVPTMWLVEGVLMYLTAADGGRVLERVGSLSAPGSRLAVEHLNQAYIDQPVMAPAVSRLAATQASWQSSVEDPKEWLAAYGWRAEITHQADLARRLGRPVPAMADPDLVGSARIWLIDATRDQKELITVAFTDDVVRDLLVSVGLDRGAAGDAMDDSFESLGLDSLARMEIATRIQERFDVDVEEKLTAETTPALMRKLVTERLAG
jgi:methyltransferase (TIGR00027 family)